MAGSAVLPRLREKGVLHVLPATDPAFVEHPLRSAVIGVLAYNEDPSIELCLRAILAETDGTATVRSVVVVASGCTDLTEVIVRRVAAEDRRVRLIIEPQRSGKAAAINLLLRESSAPIVVLVGGDVVFTPGSLVRLLEPFSDPRVGMTGARPVPTNARAGFVGNAVHVLWGLHHEVSLVSPKLGEAVAFRRVMRAIDRSTLVDEAFMEHVISSRGMQLRYVPQSVVRNHGAETVRDYLAQRVRVCTGHQDLTARTGYHVSSMHFASPARAAWRLWRQGEKPKYILFTVALEAIARLQARVAGLGGRIESNGIWHPIKSSKRVLARGHMLRSHHERFVRLRLRPTGATASRGRLAAERVRSLVRVEDEVRHDNGLVVVTVRSDELGAHALGERLLKHLPFEYVLVDGPETPGAVWKQPRIAAGDRLLVD